MTSAVAALALERGGPVALTAVRLRAPGPGELLVRIAATGICATDLFAIDGGAGDIFPAVLGHEGAGIVEAVGDGVTRVAPGDRVVLSFDSCGGCAACTAGHPTACTHFAALNQLGSMDAIARADTGEPVRGAWMAQSSWATHVVVSQRSAAVIADDVPWEVAAPLGCGILTGAGAVFNVLAPGPADSVLIVGGGTTGLAAVMASRHRGVGTIVVSEPSAERRLLAIELGATHAVPPEQLATTLAALPRITRSLDTVGSQGAIDAALGALATGGVCASVALKPGANRVEVSQSKLLWSRTLRGVIEGDADIARDIPRLVALWRAGRLPLEKLVTRYAFADADVAIAATRRGDVVKAVLLIDEADAADAAPAASPDLLDALRAGRVPDDDLAALWRSLPPVHPDEMRGLWHGFAATREHRAGQLLTASRWYGKLFAGAEDIAPIVCESDDGTLAEDRSFARGGASLRTLEHDGIVTAAMIYDARPIVDAFVRLSPDAVLGVMTGRGTDDDGRLFHFVLERDTAREVRRWEP